MNFVHFQKTVALSIVYHVTIATRNVDMFGIQYHHDETCDCATKFCAESVEFFSNLFSLIVATITTKHFFVDLASVNLRNSTLILHLYNRFIVAKLFCELLSVALVNGKKISVSAVTACIADA